MGRCDKDATPRLGSWIDSGESMNQPSNTLIHLMPSQTRRRMWLSRRDWLQMDTVGATGSWAATED